MRHETAPGPPIPIVVGEAFHRAIEAAQRFRGATAPNPPVGCVLLDRSGRVLSVGAHRKAGQPHAEAEALDICQQAGLTPQIDTVVVTLEPCNHWGRTPPCAEALLQTPARTVWIGARDPNPRVAGGGAARLRDAGLAVNDLTGAENDPVAKGLSEACRDLIAPFVKRAVTGRPWVTVKQAIDQDGSMIPPPGQKTFTSDAALVLAHRLRKRADGILTGSGTVLADDPHFTVRRLIDHPSRCRSLTILDRRGRVPASYLSEAEARGFSVRLMLDLDAALDALGHDGALEILVEAGPRLTASVLDGALWDEHVVLRSRGPLGADDATARRRLDGVVRPLRLDLSSDDPGPA